MYERERERCPMTNMARWNRKHQIDAWVTLLFVSLEKKKKLVFSLFTETHPLSLPFFFFFFFFFLAPYRFATKEKKTPQLVANSRERLSKELPPFPRVSLPRLPQTNWIYKKECFMRKNDL
jgi:hypothetical protein